MPTTDKQNRAKLAILSEQFRKHCKEKNLRGFIFCDGEAEGSMVICGYFDDNTLTSLTQQLYAWKPEKVRAAIKELEDFIQSSVQKPEEEKPKLIIEP